MLIFETVLIIERLRYTQKNIFLPVLKRCIAIHQFQSGKNRDDNSKISFFTHGKNCHNHQLSFVIQHLSAMKVIGVKDTQIIFYVNWQCNFFVISNLNENFIHSFLLIREKLFEPFLLIPIIRDFFGLQTRHNQTLEGHIIFMNPNKLRLSMIP